MKLQRVYEVPKISYPECPPVGTVLVRVDVPEGTVQRAFVVVEVDQRSWLQMTGTERSLAWHYALDQFGPLELVWSPPLDPSDEARADQG